MKSRSWVAASFVTAASVSVTVWLSGDPAVHGQSQPAGSGAAYTIPRTPWGDPDLEGIWQAEAVPTPLERPARFGMREFLNAEELAEAAKAAPIQQPGSEEESVANDQRLADHRPRDADESSKARPHE